MLHSPALMAQQIDAIVRLVEANGYAGIDIDYEQLRAGDRQDFTTFCERLARALHAKGKVLSVALFAKTSDAGSSPTNVAQDYRAIGQVADQVRLMGYDYHWAGSPPGPIAPVDWLRDVLRYAKTQIPAGKIVLGIPLYGYDWTGGHGTGVSWLQALRLSRQYHAALHYDAQAQAPWFTYTDSAGRKHTVWFENAASSRAKFDVAQGAGIGGVYLWMPGYEDTGTWSALRQALPVSGAGGPSAARPSP
jgi:spore germination protein YaaH